VSPHAHVTAAPPTSPEPLLPFRDPLAQLVVADPGAPGSPGLPSDATSFTFVKLALEALLRNAATLDEPAATELPMTGASTSKSDSDTGAATSIASNAMTVATLGATTAFAPVYVHPAPASPGHVTPPKIARPAPAFALVRLTASAYVAAHAITRGALNAPASVTAFPSVFTGDSIVPAFASFPLGATKIASPSAITHAFCDGVCVGLHVGPVSPPLSVTAEGPSLGASFVPVGPSEVFASPEGGVVPSVVCEPSGAPVPPSSQALTSPQVSGSAWQCARKMRGALAKTTRKAMLVRRMEKPPRV
jgi:hypothetical protein